MQGHRVGADGVCLHGGCGPVLGAGARRKAPFPPCPAGFALHGAGTMRGSGREGNTARPRDKGARELKATTAERRGARHGHGFVAARTASWAGAESRAHAAATPGKGGWDLPRPRVPELCVPVLERPPDPCSPAPYLRAATARGATPPWPWLLSKAHGEERAASTCPVRGPEQKETARNWLLESAPAAHCTAPSPLPSHGTAFGMQSAFRAGRCRSPLSHEGPLSLHPGDPRSSAGCSQGREAHRSRGGSGDGNAALSAGDRQPRTWRCCRPQSCRPRGWDAPKAADASRAHLPRALAAQTAFAHGPDGWGQADLLQHTAWGSWQQIPLALIWHVRTPP